MLDRTKAKENWQGKRVLVLGMARSGIAVAQLLCRFGAVPLLNARKTEQELGETLAPLRELPCEWHLGEDAEALLPQCDVLLISPGVPIDSPIVLKAREMNIPVTGELEVASQLCEGTLVALTGTNGKTTTVWGKSTAPWAKLPMWRAISAIRCPPPRCSASLRICWWLRCPASSLK